jgi:membrane associated rhomboid family serine protease
MDFNNFRNNYRGGSPFNQNNASPFGGIKRFFNGKSALSRIILINIFVFVFVNIVKLFLFLYQKEALVSGLADVSLVSYWLAVPADLHQLMLKPWTLFTYMFLHENLWHLLLNMLMLYFGGSLFTQYLGSRKFVITYIIGGLFGALFYIFAFNFFPVFSDVLPNSVALGASASVLAVIIAIATFIPNFELNLFLIGRLKFKWLAIVFVIIDLLSIQKGNAGGHIAHLGGAFWGFSYVLLLKKTAVFAGFFNKFKSLFKTKPKIKVNSSKRTAKDEDFNYQKKVHQQKIDTILDKISKSGYEGLSREEKEILFKESNKNR